MNHESLPTAIDQLLRGDIETGLSLFESIASEHQNWATPIVGLARSAEAIEDWESAFELWSQARRLIPHADEVKDGVARSAFSLMRSRFPRMLSSTDPKAATTAATTAPTTIAETPVNESNVAASTIEESTSAELTSAESAVTESIGAEGERDFESASEVRGSDTVEENTQFKTDPSPLVLPFDFDVTEFSVDAPSETIAPLKAADSVEATVEANDDSVGTSGSEGTLDELDKLIGRLEGARIVPAEDVSSVPAPNLEDDLGDIASETLATIYLDQEQFVEAAKVFDRLAEQQPDRADEFTARAHEARAKISN